MRKLGAVLVVVTLVLGALIGFASPGHAVHGCILTSPVTADVPDQPNIGTSSCGFTITTGGAYNANVVAESWEVVLRNAQGAVLDTFGTDEGDAPAGRFLISAAEANLGGSIQASVTNGAMVIGCASCDPPAA